VARDWTILAAVRDAVAATGLVDDAILGRYHERPWPAGATVCAWVSLESAGETPLSPNLLQVNLEVQIDLRVRDLEPDDRGDLADRVYAAIVNEIQGVRLADLTIGDLTRIKRLRPGRDRHPDTILLLTLSAPYLAAFDNGRDEA
jgi:hypothetical protein